ncbi:MAG: ionic transporter y4hA [Chitinophagales bacterium]|nr:ionic transporter y4hA [Chitinophagales bacterium]
MTKTPRLDWFVIFPILSWLLFLSGLISSNVIFEILAGVLLMSSVIAAVHHSEVVAQRVGEPFGTIILAVSITIIEVGIISSLMLQGGQNSTVLARDTVFAATMLILNGIIGICLLVGGVKHVEQYFSKHSANTALISLMSIIFFTLILPNYTTSIQGPIYSPPQLIFVALACLVIYGAFLFTQTVRHRAYFLTETTSEDEDEGSSLEVSNATATKSLLLLLVSLVIIVLLAKKLSPSIETLVLSANLPKSLVGVVIATIILLPEGVAAIQAAQKNRLQTSLNLALGSVLASIGLTIPTVALVSHLLGLELVLGLDAKSMLLLGLSFLTVMLSLSKGKTNMLYGVVLLVNLAGYIFTIIFP